MRPEPLPNGDGPSRAEVDALTGPLVLEFGTSWCGHCQAAQPLIGAAFARHPEVAHVRVEDGPGKPLGRSFAVRLWPTLVFLHEGREVARLVRPVSETAIADALSAIESTAAAASGRNTP